MQCNSSQSDRFKPKLDIKFRTPLFLLFLNNFHCRIGHSKWQQTMHNNTKTSIINQKSLGISNRIWAICLLTSISKQNSVCSQIAAEIKTLMHHFGSWFGNTTIMICALFSGTTLQQQKKCVHSCIHIKIGKWFMANSWPSKQILHRLSSTKWDRPRTKNHSDCSIPHIKTIQCVASSY